MTSSVQRIFSLLFKMTESFENLENNVRGRAIDKVQKNKKKTCRGTEQVREVGRRKIQSFLIEKIPKKIFEQSQSAVEQDYTKHKLGVGGSRTIALSRI